MLTLDIADLGSIPAKAATALGCYGHVDVLLNNAGQSYRGEVADTDIDVHVQLMTVNYFGHIALTKGLSFSSLSLLSNTRRRRTHLPLPSQLKYHHKLKIATHTQHFEDAFLGKGNVRLLRSRAWLRC